MFHKPLENLYERLLSPLGLVLLCLLLGLNAAGLLAVNRGAAAMEDSLALATQARQTMVSVERLRMLLYKMLAAKRGYLLSRDRSYLEPFDRHLAQVREELKRLNDITEGRPQYRELVNGLSEVVADKLKDLEKTIALAEATSFEAAIEYMRGGASERLMEYLDVNIDRIAQLEDQVRRSRLSERQQQLDALKLGLAALFGINLLLILVGAYTIMVDRRRRQQTIVDLAASRERLTDAVRQSTAELRELSVHLQHVQEAERHRLARELHDELGGTLSAIKLDVSMAASAANVAADEKASGRLARALKAMDEAIRVKRRIIEDLRPTLIDNLGYAAAFRWHCGQFTERTGCQCVLDLPEREIRLGEEHSIALYRVMQESLTNVAKYAKARTVNISMRRIPTGVEMTIADDGVGMEEGRQQHATSHGLIGMRERMASLGGSFLIESAPGKGTRLMFRLPMDKSVGTDSPPTAGPPAAA